jgi:hypothetical protein
LLAVGLNDHGFRRSLGADPRHDLFVNFVRDFSVSVEPYDLPLRRSEIVDWLSQDGRLVGGRFLDIKQPADKRCYRHPDHVADYDEDCQNEEKPEEN